MPVGTRGPRTEKRKEPVESEAQLRLNMDVSGGVGKPYRRIRPYQVASIRNNAVSVQPLDGTASTGGDSGCLESAWGISAPC